MFGASQSPSINFGGSGGPFQPAPKPAVGFGGFSLPATAPDEFMLSSLQDMGFDKLTAAKALQMCNNNSVGDAASLIMDGKVDVDVDAGDTGGKNDGDGNDGSGVEETTAENAEVQVDVTPATPLKQSATLPSGLSFGVDEPASAVPTPTQQLSKPETDNADFVTPPTQIKDAFQIHFPPSQKPMPNKLESIPPPPPSQAFSAGFSFGQSAASSPFGKSTTSPFGQSTTLPFGQSAAPSFGQSAALSFGQSAAPSPFGQLAAPSPFGQSAAPSPFGQSAAPSPFGQSNPSPFGGVATLTTAKPGVWRSQRQGNQRQPKVKLLPQSFSRMLPSRLSLTCLFFLRVVFLRSCLLVQSLVRLRKALCG
jgi:hypothetical protein